MIKINLVSEGKKPVVARKQTRSDGGLMGGENAALYWLVLGFLLFAIGFGVWWWRLNSTIKANDEQIREKERRVAELEEIIKRVEEFERKEAELERKIDVITDLKNNQRGPVEIMDEVSRALPELLWIDRLTQSSDLVTVDGRSFNTSAISTFLENIDRVEGFTEPVLKNASQNRDIYVFSLTFRKVPTVSETEAEETP